MSEQGGGGGGSRGPEFELPEEILRVIPTDPYDQLDLARKITSIAIASRVSKLESEASLLRQTLSDKDRLIFDLQQRVSHLDAAFQDADSRLALLTDQNMRLAQENDSLSATVKKLNRDLAKLETFKRQLMLSLSEDAPSKTESVDVDTYDQSVPRAYPHNEDGSNGPVKHHSFSGITELGRHINEVNPATQRFSKTPYHITPRLTPTGTPKMISASVSPKAYSAVGTPQKTSGSTTPKAQYEGNNALWYSSSQQSSAANSPPRTQSLPGRTAKIDGKEFFRQARNRLSYEQFSAFLANIKDLNSQKQSREETLKKAEEIFGTDNKDLYLLFQGLLNRNTH